jgi:hypothetical protein
MYPINQINIKQLTLSIALLLATTTLLAQKKTVSEKALTKDEIAEMKKTANDFFKGKKLHGSISIVCAPCKSRISEYRN